MINQYCFIVHSIHMAIRESFFTYPDCHVTTSTKILKGDIMPLIYGLYHNQHAL